MPPVLIAAGVTAAASIGGAVLSSKATSKAANKAADTSLQTAQANNALSREIYGQNQALLSPYSQRGNAAGDAINALLGLPGAAPAPAPAPSPSLPPGTGGLAAPRTPMPQGFYPWDDGRHYGRTAQSVWDEQHPVQMQTGPAQPAAAAPTTTPQTAQNAFTNYLNSTGYQFRLGQGEKAINQGYAARGMLESGAAMKALQTYGQNTASDEFGRYLSYLSNQQGVGLSGASAVAGVGQNYVNNVTANNNSAGTAAANAALMAGNANAQMYGGIANGLGNLAGSISSYYSMPRNLRG